MLKKIVIEFLKLKANETKEALKVIGGILLILLVYLSILTLIGIFFVVIGFIHLRLTDYILWFIQYKGHIVNKYFEVGFIDIVSLLCIILFIIIIYGFVYLIKDNWRKAIYNVERREQKKKDQEEYDKRLKKWKEEQEAEKSKKRTKTKPITVRKKRK